MSKTEKIRSSEMPYISESRLREMKATLERAKKNVKQHEQWLEELKQREKEDSERLSKRRY